jgi:hypothetical protein
MRPDDEQELPAYDETELALFAQLPREALVTPGEVDRVVNRLKTAGFFVRRERRLRGPLAAAAALVLFALGAAAGVSYTRRNSLEEMLSRQELTPAERVLLLQRAGSAYVRAAQSYADATAKIDSNAVEVASRVLIGAAHAVARNSLDAGLSARLTSVLQPGAATAAPVSRKPVVWF